MERLGPSPQIFSSNLLLMIGLEVYNYRMKKDQGQLLVSSHMFGSMIAGFIQASLLKNSRIFQGLLKDSPAVFNE